MLRHTEARSITLQLMRLLIYPTVRKPIEAGELFLHGWHYILEEYAVKSLDPDSGRFPLQEPTPPALVAWGDDLTEAGACHG
ncbi:hypothetical protein RG903_13030 [Thermithiobacillus tepidarius DSM 3134]|uniref:hypothetical protein n=1 Tax=Thermithiobacillus tepidarius TaxID=929 RepID=UPI000424C7F9|nr:hypothetical protein [Thermithiobacillus tepidarius]